MFINNNSSVQQAFHLHEDRYPGAEKEYAILYELLYRIEAPSRLEQANELTDRLKAETGLNIVLRTVGFLLYFYLNDKSGELFAHLDLSKSTMPEKVLSDSLSEDKVFNALSITRQFIEEKRGKATILNDWVRHYFKGKSQIGIWLKLQGMEIGEERSMRVNFGNDLSQKVERVFDYLFHAEAVVYKMSLLLNSGATMEISPEEKLFNQAVDDAAYQTFTIEDFITQLNTNYEKLLRIRDKEKGHYYKGYNINIYILPGSKVNRSTANLLHQMRNRYDTHRALQRLLLLGIIDDIKEEDDSFVIHFTKKEKSEYEDALSAYLTQYETSEQLKIWIDRLYRKPVIEEEHPSVLFEKTIEMRKVRDISVMDFVRILLQFDYARIVPQHAAIAQKTTEEVKPITNLKSDNSPALVYGNSPALVYDNSPALVYDNSPTLAYDNSHGLVYDKQYTVPPHQPNLMDDTSQGTHKTLEVVWKYMDEVGRVKNESSLLNIKELQISATTMQENYPSNPVFDLLNAFCVFYLETSVTNGQISVPDKARLKVGADDFIRGFIGFKDLYNMSDQDLEMAVAKFQQKTKRYKTELTNIMNQVAELLYLELRNRWLRQFKQKLYG